MQSVDALSHPDRRTPRRWVAGILPAVVVLASVLAHAPFVLDVFGEADAARLANQAAAWHAAGEITVRGYPSRVSPLYLHALKVCLDAGVPLRELPALMNWTNAVCGSLALLPLYWLWRRMAGSRAAAIACTLFWFTPAFWQANLYGMPHVPSFLFFVTAMVLFHSMRGRPTDRVLWARVCLAGACLTIACTLKADILLCGLATVAMALTHSVHRWRNTAAAVAVLVVAAAACLAYGHAISDGTHAVASGAVAWERRFPFTLQALRDDINRNRSIQAVGPVHFLTAVAGSLAAMLNQRHRRLLIVCAAWGLPPLLFWGLKLGNSPRHLMAGWAALLLPAATLLAQRLTRSWVLFAAVTLLVAANAVSRKPNGETLNPSPRLIASSRMLRDRQQDLHRTARQFAEIRAPRKMLAGYGQNPYGVFEVLADARAYQARGDDLAMELTVTHSSGQPQAVRAIYLAKRPCVLRPPTGWTVWTMERDVEVRHDEGQLQTGAQ